MGYIESGFMPALKGKIAGSVFYRSRYGNLIRNKTTPRNPKSNDQMQVRSHLGELARIWGELTEQQRSVWNTQSQEYPLERRGKSYAITGFLFFIMLNRNLQEINEPVILDFPEMKAPQYLDSFGVSIIDTPGSIDIKADIAPAINPDTKLKLYATGVIKSGVNFVKQKFNKIGILDQTFVSGSSISTFYVDKFGKVPAVGEKAFFRIEAVNIHSGLANPPLQTVAFGTL